MAKNAKVSKASQPTKAGETPVNTVPVISFQDSMNAAATKIDALLRGGVDCVTYISSALLVGYLASMEGSGKGRKITVMRDEFALALNKKGLGGTQTKKYLDYGQKLGAQMFKECSYGMEMSALIAADTPDKAHSAVVTWLQRHTVGKKTQHGFKLDEASVKLNTLGVFLGYEVDPNIPEKLDTKTEAEKTAKRRETAAKAIEKDSGILSKVPVDTLVSTVGQVLSFDVLIRKHVETMTEVRAIEKELKAIEQAYQSRIKALKTNLGKKRETQPETSAEAAAA
jgi:hypothetical protein